MKTHVIAVTNQKGGVGKTTTAIHLAHGLALHEPSLKILLIDLDPQGNATQGLGVPLNQVKASIADLIRDKNLPTEQAIYKGTELDLIPATPLLAKVEREMVGATNSELRLTQRLKTIIGKYSVIIIDTPPTFGPLMNLALNAAQKLIVPVESFYAMLGIKELLSEIEEIHQGTNPSLEVLGYVLTLADETNITREIHAELMRSFEHQVFRTVIRRGVKFKEASALGRTIFQHAPKSQGSGDYLNLADELLTRLGLYQNPQKSPSLTLVQGVDHE